MKFLVLLTMLVDTSAAQTVDLSNKACKSNSVPMLAALIPVTIGANVFQVPTCIALGPGVSLNTSVNPPRLEVSVPTTVLPRTVIHTVPLTGIPASQTSLTVSLQYTPLSTEGMVAVYTSSQYGGGYVDLVMPAGGANPKQITISPLPLHRPLTADDVVKIMYKTTDVP